MGERRVGAGRRGRDARRGRRARLAPIVVALALSLSACSEISSMFDGDDQPSAAPSSAPTAEPTSQFELRFVNPTAPPCTAVWAVGRRLPVKYEWCVADDGTPVAGPRIGSCEVVTHEDTLYGVPGYRIRQANGVLSQDRAFRRALTACKRDPAP